MSVKKSQGTYVVGVGFKVDAQAETFLAKDGLAVSTSAVRLLLGLWNALLIHLHLFAHLAVNIIAALADHLGLGQLPNSLQTDLGVSDASSSDKLAVVLIYHKHSDQIGMIGKKKRLVSYALPPTAPPANTIFLHPVNETKKKGGEQELRGPHLHRPP